MLSRLRLVRTAIILGAVVMASSACKDSTTPDKANSNANRAPAEARGSATAGGISIGSLRMDEPERYSATMRMTAQASGSQASGSPLELGVYRRGADRRWTVNSGTPGEISYLEKSGLKYLIVPGRKLYAEVPPEMLGPRPADWATPTAIIERLLSAASFENLGTELVDGRTAVKYLSAPDSQGSASQSSLIYVDQETGLPLRSMVKIAAARGVVTVSAETHDIHLSAEPAIFEVPLGMKKVGSEEVKQQIDVFAGNLRAIVAAVKQDTSRAATASSPSDGSRSSAKGRLEPRSTEPSAVSPAASRPGGPAAIVKPKNANSNQH